MTDQDYVQLKFDYLAQSFMHEYGEAKSYRDLIHIDVQRTSVCFEASRKVICNLLMLYGYYNKQVQYCQGMNFVMAFLWRLFQDEKLTFCYFDYLIKNYKLPIASPDLFELKVQFYQLERLLQIILPEVFVHFQKHKIQANTYSSS